MAQVKPVINSVWGSTGATTDPGTTKMNLGWTAEVPTHNVQNFWQQRADEMLTHLNEQGIAEWDASTTYPVDAWAKGSDGEVYRALQVATAQDPISAPAFWTLSLSGGGGAQSLADPGYTTFAGGLIMQWVPKNVTGDTINVSVSFPLTFPTATLAVLISRNTLLGSAFADSGLAAHTITTSGCLIDNGGSTADLKVLAIGY